MQCQPTSVGFRYGRKYVLTVLHGQLIFLASRPHTKLGVVNRFAVAKMIAKILYSLTGTFVFI